MNRRNVSVAVACALAVVLPILLVPALTRTLDTSLASETDPGAARGARIAGHLLLFVAYAFAVYDGFQVHTAWGLANLFIPFAVIFFMILHARRSRDVFIFLAFGLSFFSLSLVLS